MAAEAASTSTLGRGKGHGRLAVLRAVRSAPLVTGRLPAPPTPLIGRERAIAAARTQILDHGIRLLTLTGPPGVGKTRLALEVAAGLSDRFADGVFFVDLAPIRDRRLVAASMTRALGVWEAGRGSARATLERFLEDRELLILLDNFEQVIDAGAILADLLAACPRLGLLVTSRAALRLRWEQELPVAPLELPDPAGPTSADALGASPALALFVERTRAVRPDFELTDRNARTVAEICARLDGLPLAIELAAGQSRLLPPGATLERLAGADARGGWARGSALDSLAGGARDLPARQRTLRDAVEWSHNLLTPAEQVVFRRLAVFPGSFSLEAASAVCETPTEAALVALVEKSLVRRPSESEGEPRLRMLETIRDYARERLEASAEAPAIRARHAAFFVDLAEQANEGLWGHDQAAWLDRIERELDNLRAVLEWSTSPLGDLEAGLLVAGGTCRFWDMRGYFAEGRARLEALLARADTTPWPRTDDRVGRAEVFTRLAAGFQAFAQGDFATSTAHVNRAMPLAREIGFAFGVTTGLIGLASMAQIRGKLGEAAALLDEALALGQATGDERSIYHALYWQGEIARSAGDYDRAVSLLEAGLARQQGNPWAAATAGFSLGHVALVRGDPERAATLFRETLDARRLVGDRLGMALSVEGLAWVSVAHRRPDLASRMFGAAEGLREWIGASVEVGWTSDHERYLEQTRAMLDEATFDAEWAAGRALSPNEAIALALSTGAERPVGSARSSPRARHAPHAPRQGSALTPRERQVAGLIARGLTNREVAAELVITEGTAANYVQHVLEKLGFHARAQIAAWAAEHGLT